MTGSGGTAAVISMVGVMVAVGDGAATVISMVGITVAVGNTMAVALVDVGVRGSDIAVVA